MIRNVSKNMFFVMRHTFLAKSFGRFNSVVYSVVANMIATNPVLIP